MGHISTVEVRYAETDQMGIAHHSNYAIWFEVARTDFIKAAGISYTDVEKEQEKTRTAKNKKLQKEIDDEQEVKAVTKEEKEEKPEEKSLYDLIDMMYDEK